MHITLFSATVAIGQGRIGEGLSERLIASNAADLKPQTSMTTSATPTSLRSSLGFHVLDGSQVRLLHQPLRAGHHRVPLRALPLPGSHVTDVTAEQEAGPAGAVFLRRAGRALVSR